MHKHFKQHRQEKEIKLPKKIEHKPNVKKQLQHLVKSKSPEMVSPLVQPKYVNLFCSDCGMAYSKVECDMCSLRVCDFCHSNLQLRLMVQPRPKHICGECVKTTYKEDYCLGCLCMRWVDKRTTRIRTCSVCSKQKK